MANNNTSITLAASITKGLKAADKALFIECIGKVREYEKVWLGAAESLFIIKDRDFHRNYQSFDACVEDLFPGIGKRQANILIAAYLAVKDLPNRQLCGVRTATALSKVRVLAGDSKKVDAAKTQAKRASVWATSCAMPSRGKPVTSAMVEEVIAGQGITDSRTNTTGTAATRTAGTAGTSTKGWAFSKEQIGKLGEERFASADDVFGMLQRFEALTGQTITAFVAAEEKAKKGRRSARK